MHEVIANAPTASNKARAGLSKEESVRFFGPPPLIAGEDRAQYEAMRDRISAAVGPLDFLEEILVNDIVNLVWEDAAAAPAHEECAQWGQRIRSDEGVRSKNRDGRAHRSHGRRR